MFAPNYINHFSCLCGDCPDICCRGWSVHLVRRDYEVLLAAATENPQENGDILQHIAVDSSGSCGNLVGRIVWNARDECPFLDMHRLCSLYSRLGPEFQPAVCAQYPKSYNIFDDRLEMNGVLSCPEVARLLLDLENPLVWQELPEGSPAPRVPPKGPVGEAGGAFWRGYAHPVRDTLCRLVTDTTYPLNFRLIGCAIFAQYTLPAFTKGVDIDEAHRILDKAVADMGVSEFLDLLHEQLTAVPVATAMGVGVLQAIVRHGSDHGVERNEQFCSLVQRCLAGYGSTDVYVLYELCLTRGQNLDEVSRQWVDQAFGRFAHHFLLQESFLGYPDLMVYVRRLAIAVMVCRFLYYGLLGDEGVERCQEERFSHIRQTMIYLLCSFSKSSGHYNLELSELVSLASLLTFLRLW